MARRPKPGRDLRQGQRPVADRQVSVPARRLFPTAVLLTAVLTGGCGNEYEKGAGIYMATPTTTATTAPTANASASAQPSQRAGGESADESAEAQPLDAAQRRMVSEASSAARAFLAGYLPYSYGQADAAGIRCASSE